LSSTFERPGGSNLLYGIFEGAAICAAKPDLQACAPDLQRFTMPVQRICSDLHRVAGTTTSKPPKPCEEISVNKKVSLSLYISKL